MSRFIIATDSACDLPDEFLAEHRVPCVPLFYLIDGVTYGGKNKLTPDEFYAQMKLGKMPTTNAVIPEGMKAMLRPYLERGIDILYIAFSSALSSSCQNAFIAANDLMEEYPERKITVIDSKCASLGQGFLVYKCVELMEKGMNMDVLAQWAEDHVQNCIHLFTVDNLDALHRGGRVSKATAIVAGLANIKPVLHVDANGALTSLKNVRGRRKSMATMVDLMKDAINGCDLKNDIFFISHSDCKDEAEDLAAMIKKETGIEKYLISSISPTIGAHTGPGCLALFFFGKER